MRNRTAGLLIGMFGLCCLGLLLSVAYPVTPAEPHAETPAAEQFAVPDAEQYSMTGQIIVDDEVAFGFEETVTASEKRYQYIDWGNSRTEQYHSGSSEPIYIRHVMDAEANVDAMRDQITADDAQELRREDRSDGRVIFISTKNSSDPSVEFQNPAAVVVQSLQPVAYEQAADRTGGTVDFAPQAGWYGESDGYRITNTTGEVRVDTKTHAVRSASVSWEVTNPANSYAEYVLHSLGSDAPTTHEMVFDIREDDPELREPPWVADAQGKNDTARAS